MKYRPDIDGLRAIAVLPVVFYHAGFPGFGGGYVGVDVFFVISGYLITSIIVAELAVGQLSLRRFYERRARRILPALTFVVGVTVPFAWAWMPPDSYKEFSESVVAVAVFASNFMFWRESGYFAAANELKPLIHTWSLAIEEQYYILFPLMTLLLWKCGRQWLLPCLMAVAVISLGIAESEWGSAAADFYLLPARGWELATGAILATWEQRHGEFVRTRASEPGAVAGLCMLLASIVMFNDDTPHPGLATLVPVLGAALLIRFAGRDRVVSRLLASRLLVGIGLISYSLYLWHQPVFAFARIYSVDALQYSEYAALAGLSVLLAAISWRYVERPFRDRTQVSARQVWITSAGSIVVLVSMGAHGHFMLGAPNRFPEEAGLMKYLGRAAQAANNKEQARKASRNLKCSRDALHSCVIGDVSAEPAYALVGDSHAGMLWQPLAARLAARRESALLLSQGGCPYALGLRRIDRKYDCISWSAGVRRLLERSEIGTVVLIGRYVNLLENSRFDNGEGGVSNFPAGYVPVERGPWMRDDKARRGAVADSYVKSITELLELGKRVVLVYPVPEAGWDVPQTLFKLHRAGEASRLTTSYDVFLRRSKAVIDLFDGLGDHLNLVRIHPERFFCNTEVPGRCLTHSDTEVYYKDGNHLTRSAAKRVVDAIVAAIDVAWGAQASTPTEAEGISQ